jgi:hypothetical protein
MTVPPTAREARRQTRFDDGWVAFLVSPWSGICRTNLRASNPIIVVSHGYTPDDEIVKRA